MDYDTVKDEAEFFNAGLDAFTKGEIDGEAFVYIPAEVNALSLIDKAMRLGELLLGAWFAFRIIESVLQKVPHAVAMGVVALFVYAGFLAVTESMIASNKSHRRFRFLATEYVRQLVRERDYFKAESARASEAAGVRHAANRKRKADAKLFYSAGYWPTTADAGRAIAVRFHVEPKVAERWIRGWRNAEDSAAHDDTPTAAE